MRFGELTTRGLLSGMALNILPMDPKTSPNPAGLLARQSGSCETGFSDCGSTCMPTGNVCCASLGVEASCPPDYNCTATGCCPVGEFCNGGTAGCDDGKEECDGACMPEGAVCCSTHYCPAGNTCTTDSCIAGSGGGSTGGGSSGGGSSGGGGDECDAGKKTCDSLYCIPSTGVCCGDGDGAYCKAGYTCTATGCCPDGETCSGGSTGSGNSGDDDDSTSTVRLRTSTSAAAGTTATGSSSSSSNNDDDSDEGSSSRSSTTRPAGSSQTQAGGNDAGFRPPSAASGVAVPGCLALLVAGMMALLV